MIKHSKLILKSLKLLTFNTYILIISIGSYIDSVDKVRSDLLWVDWKVSVWPLADTFGKCGLQYSTGTFIMPHSSLVCQI